MARAEKRLKPCCLISGILEEAGLDREKARQIRRQILEGVILLCQWQLQRMEQVAAPKRPRGSRKIPIE